MAPEPLTLDPEVEAILREVAADPESGLLRVPRTQIVRALQERTAPVGPQTAGLTSAERELVRVHRNEVAYLLRQACWLRLAEDPDSSLYVSRFRNVREEIPVPREPELRARFSETAENDPDTANLDPDGASDLDLGRLLALLVTESRSGWPSVAQLSAASHRLEPTDQARIYCGIDLTLRGEPRSALRLYAVVLEGTAPVLHRAVAWGNMGHAHCAMGDHARAALAYRTSFHLDTDRSTPVLNWLATSFQCGAETEAAEAARRLQELASEADASVPWYVASLAAQRQRASWRPTQESRHLLERWIEQLPPAARSVANAFS